MLDCTGIDIRMFYYIMIIIWEVFVYGWFHLCKANYFFAHMVDLTSREILVLDLFYGNFKINMVKVNISELFLENFRMSFVSNEVETTILSFTS